MNIQLILMVGAAILFFFLNKGDSEPASPDVTPNDGENEEKHDLECLFNKWNEFRECAEKLDLNDIVDDLDLIFPKLNVRKVEDDKDNPLGL